MVPRSKHGFISAVRIAECCINILAPALSFCEIMQLEIFPFPIGVGCYKLGEIRHLIGESKAIPHRIRTFGKFDSGFEVTDVMLDGLVALASERGIELNEEELERSREDLCLYMKALAASSIVSRECFYRVMNSRSPEFQAALEALRETSRSSNALL